MFRGCSRVHAGGLTDNPFSQAHAYRMIRRQALAAGIRTKMGNHTFRATEITEYVVTAASPKSPDEWRMANGES
jgi:hypothetical protein